MLSGVSTFSAHLSHVFCGIYVLVYDISNGVQNIRPRAHSQPGMDGWWLIHAGLIAYFSWLVGHFYLCDYALGTKVVLPFGIGILIHKYGGHFLFSFLFSFPLLNVCFHCRVASNVCCLCGMRTLISIDLTQIWGNYHKENSLTYDAGRLLRLKANRIV